MLSVVVFDDGRGLLSPLTDLRPVFDIRTGALTTLERLSRVAQANDLPQPDALIVPERLAVLVRERHKLPVNDPSRLAEHVLLVNGACALADTDTTGVELGEAVVSSTGVVVKAHVPCDRVAGVLAGQLGGLKTRESAAPVPGLTRPWHVRSFRDQCLARDLALLLAAHGNARESISPSAKVHPSVILDSESGPILVDDHAVVRPGAILVGPVYIGPHSTVLERALMKANTAIGPHCKVAGEVGGTIFQGFANKAHDGHLGDSWIGEWANLGAGTTNSNLLNTYGEVIARPLGPDGKPGANERTGEQFLGAVIGDHVKTAICTRIMTGAIVGTGTMFAASSALSGTLPPFSWITDAGVRTYAMDKFAEVARTAMGRRKVVLGEAYLGVLRSLVPHGSSAVSVA